MISDDLLPLACVPSLLSSLSATLIDNVFVGSTYLNYSPDVVLIIAVQMWFINFLIM